MNARRAKAIAQAFPVLRKLSVCEQAEGLLVYHARGASYFVREACFWPFVFRMADRRDYNTLHDIESR